MARWGMVIDLQKCIGCQACAVVCKQTNQVPPNHWRQVFDCGISEYSERQRLSLPMNCMHCSEPPCLEVCPTTATYLRPDGIVDVNHELCVGCGYCIVACPYLARNITFHNESDFNVDAVWQESKGPVSNFDRMGVCTKCNFCLPRVDSGLAQGLQPGLDPEASPVCVNSCTAHALHFGDLDDPGNVVSQLIRENETARLQEELGTDPSVSYIVASHSSNGTEGTKIKRELIQPKKQKVWGWPAAANFILGGMATGFYLLSLLVIILQGGMAGASQPGIFKLLAPALTGLGFLALTLEAGHPLRSRHLLRHLGRSWMSRETLAGTVFIPTAILDWFLPHPVLWGLAATAALGFLISQGFIIYRSRAVTAWNVSIMPLIFVASAFATGSGLMLLVAANSLILPRSLAIIGLIWTLLNLALWFRYLYGSDDAAFLKATAALRRSSALIFTIGIGHLFPILLLGAVVAFAGLGSDVQRLVVGLAGLAIIVGGTSQKAGIILQAGYLRAIVFGQTTNNSQEARSSQSISSAVIH